MTNSDAARHERICQYLREQLDGVSTRDVTRAMGMSSRDATPLMGDARTKLGEEIRAWLEAAGSMPQGVTQALVARALLEHSRLMMQLFCDVAETAEAEYREALGAAHAERNRAVETATANARRDADARVATVESEKSALAAAMASTTAEVEDQRDRIKNLEAEVAKLRERASKADGAREAAERTAMADREARIAAEIRLIALPPASPDNAPTADPRARGRKQRNTVRSAVTMKRSRPEGSQKSKADEPVKRLEAPGQESLPGTELSA